MFKAKRHTASTSYKTTKETDMRKAITFALILITIALCSCTSTRSVQRMVNEVQSPLYYELASTPYRGEPTDSIYLDFISFSNIDYHSTVRRKGVVPVPLILYNYFRTNFGVTLGEQSLNNTYREFLTEALIGECNRSTCFCLIDNSNAEVLPDSAKHLSIKVVKNETTSRMYTTSSIFANNFLGLSDKYGGYGPAQTTLAVEVTLYDHGKETFKKTYSAERTAPRSNKTADYENTARACLDGMSENLSICTRQLVEDLSSELHLLLSGQRILHLKKTPPAHEKMLH